jgi:hypothetical protein
LLVFGFNLFPHHIDIMEILLVLFFLSYYSWGWDSWLGYLVLEMCPVELWFLEVSHSLFWKAVRYTDIYSSWREYSIDFTKHLVCIGAWTITTQDWIKCAFINDCVKGSIFVLKTSGIHLFKGEVRDLFFIHFLHLFDNSEWNINVSQMLVSIFIHFFTQSYIQLTLWVDDLTWVAAANIQNLESRLDILSDDILNTTISLIPIEWFLVPKD